MNHQSLKMHGPEHHFLVPAVLLASYYNSKNEYSKKRENLVRARKRAEQILGGFCGSHGNCGSAVGVGIFVSIITNNNPLSTESWKQTNLITAKTLMEIANSGGPRCCKRNTFIALESAIKHFPTLNIKTKIKCDFTFYNNECIKNRCKYYKNALHN